MARRTRPRGQRGLAGRIITRFEEKGFQISAMKMMRVSRELAEKQKACIAALDVLDPALLRPGRFDRRVVVPRPDVKGREGILQVHTKKVPMGADVDVGVLARATPGFAGELAPVDTSGLIPPTFDIAFNRADDVEGSIEYELILFVTGFFITDQFYFCGFHHSIRCLNHCSKRCRGITQRGWEVVRFSY